MIVWLVVWNFQDSSWQKWWLMALCLECPNSTLLMSTLDETKPWFIFIWGGTPPIVIINLILFYGTLPINPGLTLWFGFPLCLNILYSLRIPFLAHAPPPVASLPQHQEQCVRWPSAECGWILGHRMATGIQGDPRGSKAAWHIRRNS